MIATKCINKNCKNYGYLATTKTLKEARETCPYCGSVNQQIDVRGK
jgi:organic hydroperoxide reductase OsmC/OhrA